ncbi:Txe/YoeB family addiction module toxin [Bacteroidales bacterium]|nr:Txe/YoeB family addiction module toxin [Bacteroidales bacterium]
MNYEIIFTSEAEVDFFRLIKSGDKIAVKKLNALLNELRDHPETGTGKPEKLKYGLSSKWSRRISDKHRLVYEIDEEIVRVIVVSSYGHYLDK